MIGPFRTPRIVFGEGRFTDVPALAASYGRRALVFTGSHSFEDSGLWKWLSEELVRAGISWEAVRVQGEPSPPLVDEAVAAHRDRAIDVVLAVGGGSVIDAAKAAAALLPFGNSVMDHVESVGRGIPYKGPPLPFIAVPTTAGAGTEATKNAVLSERGPHGFKRSFRHDLLIPAVAVVDPELTYTCPPELTAASGLDAATQLIEGYVSTGANAFTDALALSGLEAARDGLFAAWKGEASGRNLMSYAALLSGIVLAHAGLGVVHGLASPLGALFPIPHGAACAALLPAATKTNIRTLREHAPDSPTLAKYANLGGLFRGAVLRSPEAAQDALVSTLQEWTDQLGILGLGAFGITEADLPKIAAGCTARTNPVELGPEDLVGILRESL